MELSEIELKEIWARTDEYFQFRYDEYSSFGTRLKKWRELNDITQIDMAETIYNYRRFLGLEDDDISGETIKNEDKRNEEYKAIDHVITTKIEQKKEKRITSLMRTYGQWESKAIDSSYADSPFSMTHLRILKQILKCDYEFLFCEINTPHKYTGAIAEQTGLSISTAEKLLSFDKSYSKNKSNTASAIYSHYIISALDKIISDDDLMAYISWYLTNIITEDDKKSDSSILIRMPAAGVPTEDGYLDGSDMTLSSDEAHLIYLVTIANKLSLLRRKKLPYDSYIPYNLPSLDTITLAKDGYSFGQRLRAWRDYNNYTQDSVANMIYEYRVNHDLKKNVKGTDFFPEKISILRTYQNWESNKDDKDIRISMTDLYILKTLMGCDYEYLFGEINTLNAPAYAVNQSVGLRQDTIYKLELYSKSLQEDVEGIPAYANNILTAIDLIVSDNKLLSYLAYYLTDMPFNINTKSCNILKPIIMKGLSSPSDGAYFRYLFPESGELRNVFTPAIFECLRQLRQKNSLNNKIIADHIDRIYNE